LRRIAAAVAVLLLGSSSARAQEAERDLCANRPGRGSPPCVLNAGRFQAEASTVDFTHDRQGDATTDTILYGDLNLRLGIISTGEAELSFSPYIQTRTKGAGGVLRSTGYSDLTLTWRQSLKNPDGSGVSIALQPFVTAPTGKAGFGAGGWQGGLTVPMSFALPSGFSLALTPELEAVRNAESSGSHLSATGVVGLSHPVGPVTLGAEYYVNVDQDPSGRTTTETFDFTGAWIPPGLKNTQFDVGVNAGLDHNAPGYEVYTGIAHRF
jgi:hypothetical protein